MRGRARNCFRCDRITDRYRRQCVYTTPRRSFRGLCALGTAGQDFTLCRQPVFFSESFKVSTLCVKFVGAQRGYLEGFEKEDWLTAEPEVFFFESFKVS